MSVLKVNYQANIWITASTQTPGGFGTNLYAELRRHSRVCQRLHIRNSLVS